MRILLLFIAVLSGMAAAQENKCVQIYYDLGPSHPSPYRYGRNHALLLQNLVGHFPKIQQWVIPIENYRKNDLERCASSIYLGTYFDNPVPKEFLEDFQTTSRRVAWLGYNVWQMPANALERLWRARYIGISTPNWETLDTKGHPGFFKFYKYKGQTFFKSSELKAGSSVFEAAYELTQMELLTPDAEGNVVSWAHHSTLPKRTPYVLRSENRWYVADSPFSYLHEADRYLILTDLLFDFLDEPAQISGKKPAFVRIEDVHAKVDLAKVKTIVDVLHQERVPFAMSLIAEFFDPYRILVSPQEPNKLTLAEAPELLAALRAAREKGASFLIHGASHQLDDLKNPVGLTGIDFEFWDVLRGTPVLQDSAKWAIERVERAVKILSDVELKPSGWLTPHYAASALDNVIFSQMFLWNVGRGLYIDHRTEGGEKLPSFLSVEISGAQANGQRLPYFSKMKLHIPEGAPVASQFFPYEIYGDVYGQRLVPETVGYLDPDSGVTVDTLIERVQRNSVLRDTWASFFIHPYLLDKISTSDIKRLLKATRDAGYEFVSLDDWTMRNLKPIRPEPIEN